MKILPLFIMLFLFAGVASALETNQFVWVRQAVAYNTDAPLPEGYSLLADGYIMEDTLRLGSEELSFGNPAGETLIQQNNEQVGAVAGFEDNILDVSQLTSFVDLRFMGNSYKVNNGEEVLIHPLVKVKVDISGRVFYEDGKIDWQRTSASLRQTITITFDLDKGLAIEGDASKVNIALGEDQDFGLQVRNDFWDWPDAGIETTSYHLSLYNPNQVEMLPAHFKKGTNPVELKANSSIIGTEYYTFAPYMKVTSPTVSWTGVSYNNQFKKTVSTKQESYFAPPSGFEPYNPEIPGVILSTVTEIHQKIENKGRTALIWIIACVLAICLYIKSTQGKKK